MKNTLLTLDRLEIGQKGRVFELKAADSQRRRFADLGLTTGTIVEALHKSPVGDPKAYSICGAVIAIRNTDAANIIITALQ